MKCINHSKWATSVSILYCSISTVNLFTINLLGIRYIPIFIVVATSSVMGYLLDIDTKASISRRKFRKISLFLLLFIGIPGVILYVTKTVPVSLRNYSLIPFYSISIIMFVVSRLKHRRETHSLVLQYAFINIIFAIMFFTNTLNNVTFAILLGTLIGLNVHALTDVPTHRGAPLLYPMSRKRFKIPGLKIKNGPFEDLLGTVALIVGLCSYILTMLRFLIVHM